MISKEISIMKIKAEKIISEKNNPKFSELVTEHQMKTLLAEMKF